MKPDAPAWQRHPLFRIFASVKLAMVLIAVLIVAIIIGTLYESSFDAKVARAYIYEAPWFSVWMLLLAANLTGSAFSRMPWKKHHTGFLLTHLGIIVLLTGAWIGRRWGVEGSMTIFKGEPPQNLLTVDEHIMQVIDADGTSVSVPLEMINRHPTHEKPWALTKTPSGWTISAIDYSAALDVKMVARAVSQGGAPALHFTIKTARMGQSMDSWVLADDPDHGTFDMGLATVEFKHGEAAPVTEAESGAADLEETVFAFANSTQGQVSKVIHGGSTGAKVQVTFAGGAATGTSAQVTVQIGAAQQVVDIAQGMGKQTPVPLTPYSVKVEQYWPDFQIKDGKPSNASDQPNNPCALVTISGHGVPVTDADAAHDAPVTPGAAPDMAAVQGKNHLTLYTAADGTVSYRLTSRMAGVSSGKLELHKPLATGWADWTLEADQFIPSAEERFDAHPADATSKGMHAEGVMVRATNEAMKGSPSVEQWVPLGWQVSLPTEPKALLIGYGNKQVPLPIGLTLKEFQVDWNEGTDTPAGFKSTLDVVDRETGDTVTGQCWMNHPMSVPDSWFATLTGLTYKLSQASWNPQNLSQSSIQILRDPGWSLKWIGSLVMVSGIFILFYLRPIPLDDPRTRKGSAKKNQRTTKAGRKKPAQPIAVSAAKS